MREKDYHAEDLLELFEEQTIATLPELKTVLGTSVDMTVFRKLKELGYRASYSHRGKYYALEANMDCDELGLWSFESVRFSRYGNLLDTAHTFVAKAEAGYFTSELKDVLNVGVKEALLKLFKKDRVWREKMSGLYLYCSCDCVVRRRQIMTRRTIERERGIVPGFVGLGPVPDEIMASIVLLVSTLDEKQRRLYAGLESLKLGHGGDLKIAELIGMNVHTVARGRRELLSWDVEQQAVRKAGGGRKPIKKKPLK